MKLVRQTQDRIILEDELGKPSLTGNIALFLLAAFFITVGLYSQGYIPNTDPWRIANTTGERSYYMLIALILLPLLLIVGRVLWGSYSRITLDKARNRFVLNRIRPIGTTERDYPLSEVAECKVAGSYETYRLEFVLTSGAKVAPLPLSNSYDRDELGRTALTIEEFLGKHR